MQYPKVTIIIPNFNHARFLEKRVQSVLNQTYEDFEVIYIDDASTDESNEIFSRFEADKRIRAIYNKTNSGVPFKQWNKGVRLARGEYIWIAESDDFVDSHFLERLVPILDNNPNVGIVYCQSYYANEKNDIVGTHFDQLLKLNPRLWREDFILSGREMLSSYMVIFNVIPNASAVLFRKSVFQAVGGACESMRVCGDWMTWAKMLMKADVGFVKDSLNYFRTHDTTARSTVHKQEQYIFEYTAVVKYICDAVLVSNGNRKRALEQIKVRWWKIADQDPSEITPGGMIRVFERTRQLGGITPAAEFIGIGLAGKMKSVPALTPVISVARLVARRLGFIGNASNEV